MTTKAKKVRVGAFVVGVLALFAFALVVFGKLAFWRSHDTYKIEFSNTVIGLENGAYVYLEGIHVGRVADIGFGRGKANVIVTIEIDDGTPIHDGSRALLQLAGITGLKIIDIQSGPADAPLLADGSTIPQGQTTLDKLEKTATDLAQQSSELMRNANAVIQNIAQITSPQRFAKLDDILENTRNVTANLARTTGALDDMIANTSGAARQSLFALRDAANSASELLQGRVGTFVGNADALLARFDDMLRANEGPLKSAVFDLRQASRNFKELSRDVRQRPSRLLFSPTPTERKLP